ncbi:hypothetical protein V493_07315 [Pseudogymnoascus sp. VKM F-4281 (FW-2241)]|nr:hypothetical protein V493_07315 [Pseudogymnoascus sp. VKM F-4281 (FW-2241)]
MDVDNAGSSSAGLDDPTKHDDSQRSVLSQSTSSLLNLPAELLDCILSCLSPKDLDAATYSCRHLYILGTNDRLWQRLVQENSPGYILESPWPRSSYRSLYRAHDPHWFVPKMKIWFGDQHLFGGIMLTSYNPSLGTIDGYRLVAERATVIEYPWEHDPDVTIMSFKPNVRLHRDIPMLRLKALNKNGNSKPKPGRASRRYNFEIPMYLSDETNAIAPSRFILSRRAEYHQPESSVWPPVNIPSSQRAAIRDITLDDHRRVLANRTPFNRTFTGSQKPRSLKEINEHSFRIGHWDADLRGEPLPVSTYATLDPALYTPTDTRPFRGIWVGDYSAHGCEFMLLNQPDVHEPFDESTIVKQSDESQEQFLARKKDAQIYRGRLEAIKLTGDPNIPRGEYTFLADNIGDGGLVRIAEEDQFKGARIVQCLGQLANRNYSNPAYFVSELILISPNRIAHYWKKLKIMTFHERVKLDDFIIPSPQSDLAN